MVPGTLATGQLICLVNRYLHTFAANGHQDRPIDIRLLTRLVVERGAPKGEDNGSRPGPFMGKLVDTGAMTKVRFCHPLEAAGP